MTKMKNLKKKWKIAIINLKILHEPKFKKVDYKQ